MSNMEFDPQGFRQDIVEVPRAILSSTEKFDGAALAAQFQPLDPVLNRIRSQHKIYYQPGESAAEVLVARYRLKPQDPGRQPTDKLAQRAIFLGYVCDPDDDIAFFEYYTPAEVITLSDRILEVRSKWEEAGFLEKLLADAEPIACAAEVYAERNEEGHFIRRNVDDEQVSEAVAEELEPTIWDQTDSDDDVSLEERLAETASRASEVMRHYMLAGFTRNVHRFKYLINMAKVDHHDIENCQIRAVEQFVADTVALEILGSRQAATRPAMEACCQENAKAIRAWMQEHAPYIDRLPADFQIQRRSLRSAGYLDHVFREASAAAELRGLVNLMEQGLQPGSKIMPVRSVHDSPEMFYSLQRRIAIAIDKIIQQLPDYQAQAPTSVAPIVPLE